MEFLFGAIFELLGIIIYHFFNIGFIIFSGLLSLIPVWVYIVFIIVFIISLISKLSSKKS